MIKLLIPEDWKWEKLDDALDFVIGGDWGKDENFEDLIYGPAYCIRGCEIKNWEEDKGRTATLRKIKLSNIEKRKLVEGDILVEISGGGPEQPVGRTVLIDKTVLSHKPEIPKICTNFLRLIRPKDYVDGKFLNLYLKLFYYSGEIVKYQGGSNNLRNLKFPDYVKINFPLPPKPTQLAIVSKIEELFSELDKGIENLRMAQQQLKTYRQSVLKWAFEGRLTNENVKEGELPERWKMIKMADVTTNFDGKRIPLSRTVRAKRKGIYRYYGATEIVDYIDDFIFEGEFLLIGEDGANLLSKARALAFIVDGRFWVNNHAHVLQAKASFANKYLCYYFNSLNLAQFVTGTAQPKLTQGNLNKIEVPICAFEEQNNIVQEIESRLSVADKMEESISQSLQQSEALRQSILKKAFEGKLI